MANLLTIEKLTNDLFSFIVNGDSVNKVQNVRNDLLTIGNECHFKTANGANIIKQQNILYNNITLIDGVTNIIPTSVNDLFDKLTTLGFFDWFKGTGAGSVDRFDELLDTFDYFGNDGKTLVVDESQLKLIPVNFPNVNNSTDLGDMPATLISGKMLKVNAGATAYELVDPPAGANGYISQFTYVRPNPQTFTLGTSSNLIMVVYNGGILSPIDWVQSGSLLTINPTVTLVDNDKITALGVI